ncbi:MAG: preprotein translocase subunit SecE [Candidatus Dormibacteria bacterium]
MAKAVRAAAGPRSRAPALTSSSRRGNYLKDVWEELKKVLWPTRKELTRMTGIVIATVFIFAGIIGVADYGLGLVVKQLYAAPGTAQKAPARPAAPAPVPSAAPRASAPAAPRASAPVAPGASAPGAPGAAAPGAAVPGAAAPAAPASSAPTAAPAASAPAVPAPAAPVPQP